MRVVVIGGSAAGLATALLLARDGHDVEVVDHDDLEPAADVDAAAKVAFRRAAPQVVHTHQHQPLARLLLRDRLPDVYVALLAAGAVESPLVDRMPPTLADRSPRPGDEDLTALQVRRSTFDWVLRTVAMAQRGLRLAGRVRVTGLLADSGDPPRVRGVRTERGEIRADVVVDAAGRRSAIGRWLGAIGARAPRVMSAECGIGYYTRHYRLRRGSRRPGTGRLSMIALLRFFTVAAVTADENALMLALCPLVEDRPLRALRDPAAHAAVARTVPALSGWLDAADPTSDVYAMGGLRNTLRRLIVDGRPVALGLHAVGDAVCTTNPTLGRGLSLALQGAVDLVSVLARHPDDPWTQACATDDLVARNVAPWYAEQASVDSTRLTAIRRAIHGTPPAPLPDLALGLTPAHLRVAGMADPTVFRALVSLISMVRRPADVYRDPDITERVRAVLATGVAPPTLGPSRAELLGALDGLR